MLADKVAPCYLKYPAKHGHSLGRKHLFFRSTLDAAEDMVQSKRVFKTAAGHWPKENKTKKKDEIV